MFAVCVKKNIILHKENKISWGKQREAVNEGIGGWRGEFYEKFMNRNWLCFE
jgi:hypothetical protein